MPYNAISESSLLTGVYNLSDDDLEAIEAGQCTADCPAANSAKNEKGDGKGKRVEALEDRNITTLILRHSGTLKLCAQS